MACWVPGDGPGPPTQLHLSPFSLGHSLLCAWVTPARPHLRAFARLCPVSSHDTAASFWAFVPGPTHHPSARKAFLPSLTSFCLTVLAAISTLRNCLVYLLIWFLFSLFPPLHSPQCENQRGSTLRCNKWSLQERKEGREEEKKEGRRMERRKDREFLAVQWLGLRAFMAEGPRSIPGPGAKLPQRAGNGAGQVLPSPSAAWPLISSGQSSELQGGDRVVVVDSWGQ